MKHLCILATWIFKIWYILCIGAIQVYADGITLKSSKDTSHWSLNVHTFPYNNQLLQMVQFLSDKKFGNSITVNLMYRNKQVFLHDCMLIVFPVKKNSEAWLSLYHLSTSTNKHIAYPPPNTRPLAIDVNDLNVYISILLIILNQLFLWFISETWVTTNLKWLVKRPLQDPQCYGICKYFLL